MNELSKLMRERHSARVIFDPKRRIPEKDLKQILEAARWAPTAHNMQNFELIVVDDKNLLEAIGKIRHGISMTFIRENFSQLSFSEEELRRRKVGILGAMFPPSWRNPDIKKETITDEGRSLYMGKLIRSSSALLFVLYDPRRRAPASQGDFLGIMSLGCVMENIWLMANSLGIGVHILSSLSAGPVADKIKTILKIPKRLRIACSLRLGYPVSPVKYLRVRRGIENFTGQNQFEKKASG